MQTIQLWALQQQCSKMLLQLSGSCPMNLELFTKTTWQVVQSGKVPQTNLNQVKKEACNAIVVHSEDRFSHSDYPTAATLNEVT